VSATFDRVHTFCARFGLRVPILLGPMSGVHATSLSIAVANAGGLGACGVLVLTPAEIAAWAAEFRAGSSGPFQLNNWIRDPAPARNRGHEARVRDFLAKWGPPVAADAGDATPPDFDAQCAAMLDAKPAMVSSVMGLYPPALVDELKRRGIAWIAGVSSVTEAKMAADAGADVIAAQGAEAGGHRGAFDPSEAERRMVGLVALVPAIVDAVKLPVVAAGGIADARGAAAALALGASAVQIGTAFLKSPESKIPSAWAAALASTLPENTVVTRAFSGRPGRSIATDYVRAAMADAAPTPAPYPVQRGLTAAMRAEAAKANDVQRMQPWAGQSAALGQAMPAGDLVAQIWDGVRKLLA
jgi:nitronate monooxygenase